MSASRPGSVTVRWLGHASVVLDLGDVRLLTDPLLQRHAGLLRRRGGAPDVAAWRGAAAVLLSHLHYDHTEIGSLELLDHIPLLSAPANVRWLHARGFDAAVGLHGDAWWAVPGSDVQVRLTHAVHGDRPMRRRPNAANGFVVAAPGLRIWFAGDTAPFPAMAHLHELADGPIDLALVPVGGWGPRLSGGHMDPVQAAHACAASGARTAIPVHWGTLHAPASRRLPPGWMDRAGAAFRVALERYAPDCQALVLEPGEAVDVVARDPAG